MTEYEMSFIADEIVHADRANMLEWELEMLTMNEDNGYMYGIA